MLGCASVTDRVGGLHSPDSGKGSSAADTGFYFLPESLCLSLIESNLKGDRSPLQVLQDQFVAWCAQITGHVMGGGR